MHKIRETMFKTGLAAVLAAATVCGSAYAADDNPLSGATLTVGSKEFTEQLVLGYITMLVLEDAGATVEDQIGLGGTSVARQALAVGEIDMYWEYTGTGWITHLGHTQPIYQVPDKFPELVDEDYKTDDIGWIPEKSEKLFDAVAEEDLKKNGIKWVAPAPANNTYAIAVRAEAWDQLGVKQLSDFQTLLKQNPEEATLCVNSEFRVRSDGLPGMSAAYGISFPRSDVRVLQSGLIYQAVANGEPCNFGVVFKTDGRIAAFDLKLIEDDQNFFPIYNPTLTLRQETFEKYPIIKDLFVPVAKKLTTDTLQSLNAKVDVEGHLPQSVARTWLQENGFIE